MRVRSSVFVSDGRHEAAGLGGTVVYIVIVVEAGVGVFMFSMLTGKQAGGAGNSFGGRGWCLCGVNTGSKQVSGIVVVVVGGGGAEVWLNNMLHHVR